MRGLRLAEMDAVEMLDILHFMFEEDLDCSSAEQAEAKSNARTVVYESLYNKPYKYKVKGSSTGSSSNGYTYANGSTIPSDGFYGGTEITEFDPTVPKVTKPYTPPTEFNPDSSLPYGNTLDAPLG